MSIRGIKILLYSAVFWLAFRVFSVFYSLHDMKNIGLSKGFQPSKDPTLLHFSSKAQIKTSGIPEAMVCGILVLHVLF